MLDVNNDFNDLNFANDEEAIKKAINHLKHIDPANANREYAKKLLEHMQHAAELMADASKMDFEEFVDRYNQSRKND